MSHKKEKLSVDEIMKEIRSDEAPSSKSPPAEDLFKIAVSGIVSEDVQKQVHDILNKAPLEGPFHATVTPELLSALNELGEQQGEGTSISRQDEETGPQHVNELLGLQDEDFINKAYQVMLGRNPDRDGFEHFLEKLRSADMSKHEILGRMRLSAEGRTQKTKLKGLFAPFLVHTFRRVPLIGRFFYMLVLIANLPTFVRNFQIMDNSVHRRFLAQERFLHEVNREREALTERHEELRRFSGDIAAKLDEVQKRLDEQEYQHMEHVRSFSEIVHRLEEKGNALEERSRFLQEEIDKDRRFSQERTEEVVSLQQEWNVNMLDRVVSQDKLIHQLVDDTRRFSQERTEEVVSLQQEWNDNMLDRVGSQDRLIHQLVDDTRRMNHEMLQMTEKTVELQSRFRYLLMDTEVAVESVAQAKGGEGSDAPVHVPMEFYNDLENAFRGSREDILSRLEVYLPLLHDAVKTSGGGGVLDMGCGRGEWLELCGREGISALGVDTNLKFVEFCREHGLQSENADVFDYLPQQEESNLSMVTAFHLIEHLAPMKLMALIHYSLRALKPGGVVLFETPNPENLNVGSHRFYIDPTHRNPIPPITGSFLLQHGGFEQVEILRLHPEEGERYGDERLNTLLLGPQDYAVIGRKPK
jgi:2-polyprenyl-3-methyl-5-hydroxy-6-metoxy-1,4-benzoquinol methylase